MADFAERIKELQRVRYIGAGGGWLNRPAEAWPFMRTAVDMVGSPLRVYAIPTPTSDPCNELKLLRQRLRKLTGPTMEFEYDLGGNSLEWPTHEEFIRGLTEANLIVIPGGNFATYMELLRKAKLLKSARKLLIDGHAVVVGSSNGTVSPFDYVHTADRPISKGGNVYKKYRIERGLRMFPGYVCAHYAERNSLSGLARAWEFQRSMRLSNVPIGSVGFGIDTPAAFVIDSGHVCVHTRDRFFGLQQVVKIDRRKLKLSAFKAADDPRTLEEFFAAA